MAKIEPHSCDQCEKVKFDEPGLASPRGWIKLEGVEIHVGAYYKILSCKNSNPTFEFCSTKCMIRFAEKDRR